MSDSSFQLSVASLVSRFKSKVPPGSVVYGIPRGGQLALYTIAATGTDLSQFTFTNHPEEATVFVDDVYDSGRTMRFWNLKYPGRPFIPLVDKRLEAETEWIVFPWETGKKDDAVENVTRMLQHIGEDPRREGLRETPERVVRSWKTLFSGYTDDVSSYFKSFTEGACDEMVLLRDIEFYSTCEHHVLPFKGKAHIAYIPNGKVIGVSKLARILDVFARRMQIQERIGQQVTEALMQYLNPKGAACVLEAQHYCMTARGVQKQNSVMVTSSLRGCFRDEPDCRSELFRLIGK